jgi:hypothetical protein
MIRRLIPLSLPELKCLPMKHRIFAAILSLGIFTSAGCEMDKVTDYKNQTLESFWASYSLNDERLKPYQVDGVLVSLAWPQAGYQHYDASLALIAPSSGAEIEVLRLEVRNLGALPLRAIGEIKVDQQIEGRALYRADRVIAVKIEAERLKQIAAANGGKLEAVLSVRVRRNGASTEKVIVIPFEEKVRKYAPMR